MLGEPRRHRENLRRLPDKEVTYVERNPHHDGGAVDLPSHESPMVLPSPQSPLASTTHVGQPHDELIELREVHATIVSSNGLVGQGSVP